MKHLLALWILFVAVIDGWADEGATITITSGRVCGTRRLDAKGLEYASFRGVPFAKPPLGALRFAELQEVDPWTDCYNATVERDICPQTDILYKRMMQPRGMSEDCMHANIHVPIAALPEEGTVKEGVGLPIHLFVHGGGFQHGAQDTDVHGPERLIANDVIIITFNYRLNIFGFLSLNSTKIPGNNALRDIIFMLRWVRENAASFGGNADDITLGGQSAGAALVHFLTLSPAAQGLFKRAVLLSGTAIAGFITTSPTYASSIANDFLSGLGINSTDPDEIHQLLVDTPIESIIEVNKNLQDEKGILVFLPVQESVLPGVTTIIPEDPFTMLSKGYGKDIPLIIGYTNAEFETFRNRLVEIDAVTTIKSNSLALLPFQAQYTFSNDVALQKASSVQERYFKGTEETLDEYIKLLSDSFFEYPALRLAQYRQQSGGAPTFLYEYTYEAAQSVIKTALNLNYTYGAAHIEDLTAIFKVNSVPVPYDATDDAMNSLMAEYIANFTKYSNPIEESLWQPVDSSSLVYQAINGPKDTYITTLTDTQTSLISFFDGILGI